MNQEPSKVDPKVGTYNKSEGSGAKGGIVTAIVVALAILLVLWLFTDVL